MAEVSRAEPSRGEVSEAEMPPGGAPLPGIHGKGSLRPLIVFGLPALVLWILGVTLAQHHLPEWLDETIEGPGYFTGQFEGIAETLGFQLIGENPDVELFISGSAGHHDLRKRIQVAQRSSWQRTEGRLQAHFAPKGYLEGLIWTPLAFRALLELSVNPQEEMHRPEDLAPLLLWPGEAIGATLETTVAGVTHQLIPVIGSDEPAYLEVAVSGNPVFEVYRRRGDAAVELERLADRLMGRVWIRLALLCGLLGTVVMIFLGLLWLRRIDFRTGLYLMVLALLVPLPSLMMQLRGGLPWWHVLPAMFFAAFFLLLLWSVAESWARTADPGFNTSLDFLRAGHLGHRGGRALLAGWLMGMGLAGIQLLIQVAAGRLPWVDAEEPSVAIPLFGPIGHPFYQGPMLAGCLLLAVPIAHRLFERRWRFVGASFLGALLLVPSSPYSSLTFALAAAGIVALWLMTTYRRFGLAALLVATTLSILMTGCALLLPVATWAPVSLAVSLAIILWVPWLGWIGWRRPPEASGRALVPGFVQRVEEERRMRYEMALLAEMQIGMLPGEPPRLDGYELAARSLLATEAGGDLYDFVEDDSACLWIAAGDVAGHGYSCAIELAMIKAAIHSLVSCERRPAEVLQRIDQVLRSSRKVRSFSSLLLVRLDPVSGRLVMANAGHPYPWIRGTAGVREVDMPGLPLGQGPQRTYGDHEDVLAPGEAMFVASDGLFEAVDGGGHTFGFERPRRLLEGMEDVSATAILESMVDDWRTFLGSRDAADDTSLVVLRRRPGNEGDD